MVFFVLSNAFFRSCIELHILKRLGTLGDEQKNLIYFKIIKMESHYCLYICCISFLLVFKYFLVFHCWISSDGQLISSILKVAMQFISFYFRSAQF
jgi:hypothetical protein